LRFIKGSAIKVRRTQIFGNSTLIMILLPKIKSIILLKIIPFLVVILLYIHWRVSWFIQIRKLLQFLKKTLLGAYFVFGGLF